MAWSRRHRWRPAALLLAAIVTAVATQTARAASYAWTFSGLMPTSGSLPTVGPDPMPSGPGRFGAAAAYDSASQSVVLFGGRGPHGQPLNDTWQWQAGAWKQLSPANSPSPRYGAGMAFDSAHGYALLFGGLDQNLNGLTDTWEWTGSDWVQLAPSNVPFGESAQTYFDYSAAMAFDAVHQDLVLVEAGGLTMQTWLWSGTNWVTESPVTSPPTRNNAAFAWDGALQRVMLYNGDSYTSGCVKDLWGWDGGNWSQYTITSALSCRSGASMYFDPALNEMLFFGGLQYPATLESLCTETYQAYNQTWLWDGTFWTQLQITPSPPARFDAVMAYDNAQGAMVLFSGYPDDIGLCAPVGGGTDYLDDTWLFTP